MSKLRFCFVTTFYPPYNFGGDGIFVQRLARALAERDHEVDVVHSADAFLIRGQQPGENPPLPGVTTHPLSAGSLGKVDVLLNHQLGRSALCRGDLKKLLSKKYDVIHYHNVSLVGGLEALSLGSGLKLCTLHDYWFVCPTHVLWKYNREPCTMRSCFSCTLSYRRPPQWWRMTDQIERAVKNVDVFIAPSASSIEIHKANGFPADIALLPHFVPHPIYSPEQPAILSKLKTNQYFVYSGRLEKLKGIDLLVEAFRTYRNADLLIAGSGTLEHQLRHQISDLDHVHFLGSVKPAELNVLYRGAIATIAPYLGYETFGLVLAESLATGTPVIAHKIGALPEVLASGGGLLYESKEELLEHIATLQVDCQKRNILAQEGIDAFHRYYTEEIHMERYLNMIKNRLGNKSEPLLKPIR